MTMMRKKRSKRSTAKLTTLDSFLREQGKLEEFEAVAVKEVLAWQIAEDSPSFRGAAKRRTRNP